MTLDGFFQILIMIAIPIFLFLAVYDFREWKKRGGPVPPHLLAAAALTVLAVWSYISSNLILLPVQFRLPNAVITFLLMVIAVIFRWRR